MTRPGTVAGYKRKEEATARFVFMLGTGKLAGITGGGDYTSTPLRPTSAGNSHGYSKGKGSYKLP